MIVYIHHCNHDLCEPTVFFHLSDLLLSRIRFNPFGRTGPDSVPFRASLFKAAALYQSISSHLDIYLCHPI